MLTIKFFPCAPTENNVGFRAELHGSEPNLQETISGKTETLQRGVSTEDIFGIDEIKLNPAAELHGFDYTGNRHHVSCIAHVDLFLFGHLKH